MKRESNRRQATASEEVLEAALGLLGEGDSMVRLFQERIEKAPTDDLRARENVLASIFEDIVRELTDIRKNLARTAVSGRLRETFSGREPGGVLVLTLSESEQTLVVVRTAISAATDALRPVLGSRSLQEAAGTIDWQALRALTSSTILDEAGGFFSVLYRRLPPVLGRRAVAVIENAYRTAAWLYPYLPATRYLLSVMPAGLLLPERAERLSQLERLVDRGAQDLSSANDRLQAQTKELIKTVGELKEANVKLQSVDAARSSFIGVVSHQFRTPLSAIRWTVNSLEDGGETMSAEERAEALAIVDQKAKFLIGALNKIFHTLAIDTDSAKLDLRPAFLWEIVQEQVEKIKKEAQAKGLVLTFDRSDDTLVQQNFDSQKISEVVEIILTNAVNFTPEGKVEAHILPVEREGRRFLALEVADTGIGIPKGELEKVFVKFFRGKEAIKTVADGTGLGMYIVKHFAEMHGGAVEVVSRPEGGTKVTVFLPLLESEEVQKRG